MSEQPRRTRQRIAVEAVLGTAEGFLTAQDVYDQLRHAGAGVGLATVYRTLQALADAGEVDVLRTPEGQTGYRHCSSGHHHHLVCRTCGRTVEISAPDDFEAWATAVASRYGFADIDHHLELSGRCATC